MFSPHHLVICFVHGTLIAVFSFNETEWRQLYISDTVVMASQSVVDQRLCMDMQMILEVSCIRNNYVFEFPWSELQSRFSSCELHKYANMVEVCGDTDNTREIVSHRCTYDTDQLNKMLVNDNN